MAQQDIPWHALSEEALLGVIEEFVSREGTEYGTSEVSLAEKCAQVKKQLTDGRAKITWDDETMTCTIVAVP